MQARHFLIVTVALLLVLPHRALAWGTTGHRYINNAAAQTLPDTLPQFLRTPAAVLAALVQATMLKGLATQPNIGGLLAVGLLVTGGSFLPLALHLRGAEVFAFAVIFTFGEAITVPMLDAAAGVAAEWSVSAGSAFGLMAVGWAIGGLVGNDLGGLAFSVAAQHQPLPLPWMCFFLVGLGSAGVLNRSQKGEGETARSTLTNRARDSPRKRQQHADTSPGSVAHRRAPRLPGRNQAVGRPWLYPHALRGYLFQAREQLSDSLGVR